ncbi:AsnC family protein [Oerskovia merdavium]|uniref:AsnC family protein n=1 Tax=Oerskovia merdavium TaxID=2762227 RepID=A0ABR8U4G3_9CELL|nr:AsnC family protein [Oerskovia merdavium]MBD7982930.1 AsnC family protein [Oerskovia merdavium]
MSWSTDDGAHEGAARAVFADGALSGSHGPGDQVTVGIYADGSRAGLDADVRSEDGVVGWRGWCSCGWRSARAFTRVHLRELEDRANKIAYEESAFAPQWVEDEAHAEWLAHIAPDVAASDVATAAREAAEAARRLDLAVLTARAVGASWDAIGRAAGMTRQSAHERWASATAQPKVDRERAAKRKRA